MRLIKSFFFISILLINILTAAAQETQTPPRVAPDQPLLWGLKRAIENIDEALTLSRTEKAQKGLDHAHERLLEIRKMYAGKKIDAAAKGEDAHTKKITYVKKQLGRILTSSEKATLEKALTEQERTSKKLKKETPIEDIKGTRFLLKDPQNTSSS